MNMEVFQFKQFSIRQQQAAMKVGTDGVLLGAWAPLDHGPESILDVGAGTGLLALMLAQRSDAHTIDAIEIEPGAFEECVHNFEASAWGDRLFCYHGEFGEFSGEMEDRYDLIVSNPPYYGEAVKSEKPGRATARQQVSLPPDRLLSGVASLLESNGVFALVLPYAQEGVFRQLAEDHGLYPQRITRVRGRQDTPIKRSLLAFSANRTTPVEDEIVIQTSLHQYTPAYQELVREFYLKL